MKDISEDISPKAVMAIAEANAVIEALLALCTTREERMQALDKRIEENLAFLEQWISQRIQ